MAELSFPVPALGDEVVSLRPWRETDVPAKPMAFGDPVVQRFSWSRTAPYSEADARGYFVEQEQARLRGEELHFAFVEPLAPPSSGLRAAGWGNWTMPRRWCSSSKVISDKNWFTC